MSSRSLGPCGCGADAPMQWAAQGTFFTGSPQHDLFNYGFKIKLPPKALDSLFDFKGRMNGFFFKCVFRNFNFV